MLLISYTALLLLLALHHHHHGLLGANAVVAVPLSSAAHEHLAAECPLLYYSVTAFQAPPGEKPAGDMVYVRRLVVPVLDDNSCCIEAGTTRSRAPPVRA
ncbi:MAG: hypothetical protein KFF77_11785 [Bacteroidetes bacterium]|nr:hypothetical protein [Bacteroidota bacterium]